MVRHGETDWNVARRLQGRENIELNISGIHQANICGEAIRHLSVDEIYSSPLDRARDTATIIAKYVGKDKIRTDELLIERDFGEASGLTYEMKREKYQETAIPGVESMEAVQKRMLQAFNNYANEHPDGKVLVVTHGAAIKCFLKKIENDIDLDSVWLKNAGITVIDVKDGNYNILDLNQEPKEFANKYIGQLEK